MKNRYYYCLLLSFFCTNLSLTGQHFDKKHLSVGVSVFTGRVLRVDPEVKEMLQNTTCSVYNLTFGYSTLPADHSVYAPDYNYPMFGLGLSVADFSRAQMYGPSRIGNIYTLYGFMNRPLVRQPYLSFGYNLEAGLSYGADKYNPVTNPGNHFVGSPLMVYVGAGVDLKCRLTDRLEVGFGMGAKHYSNGRTGMPNKGINILGGSLSACYYFDASPRSYPKPEATPFTKHFYYHLSIGGGGQASLQEWELSKQQPAESKQKQFKLYPKASISADAMYRYSQRYGTGVGLDIFYTPHTNRLREWDNKLVGETVDGVKYKALATGLAINQEVYYGNLAMSVAVGWYAYRQPGIRDNDSPFYQRAGFRYYFPALNNLFVGYAIKAHNFQTAEYLEFSVGVRIR